MSEKLQAGFGVKVVTELSFVSKRFAQRTAENASMGSEEIIRQNASGRIGSLSDITFGIEAIKDTGGARVARD